MIGVELAVEGAAIVQACLERQLLINCTQGTVLRLLPALNITPEQVKAGIEILTDALLTAPV
jgi:acetylornithine/succinyldiaminopimelate/putrescine aminotransferase